MKRNKYEAEIKRMFNRLGPDEKLRIILLLLSIIEINDRFGSDAMGAFLRGHLNIIQPKSEDMGLVA